jgi:hypothetical protein
LLIEKIDPANITRVQDMMTGAYFGRPIDRALVLNFRKELHSLLENDSPEARRFLAEAFEGHSFEERRTKTQTLLHIVEDSTKPSFDPRWNVFQDALDSLSRIHGLAHEYHQKRAA